MSDQIEIQELKAKYAGHGVDLDRIAAFYATVIHGLGARAGDGVPRAALMAVVEGAMAAWEPLTR